MKKFLSILLTLALMLGALAIPALADLASADIQLYPICYILNDYGDTEVSLKIYMRVVNNSSHPLWIRVEDAQTDGTPLYAAGMSGIEAHFDTSNGTPDYILITPDDNKEAGAAALRKRGLITMTVIAKDDLEYDELARESFQVDLSSLREGLPDSNTTETSYTTDNYDYSYDSSSNTAPAYTPASYDFQTLKQGSKGQAVRDLQQRLTDLGYLCDKIDGSYGRNTNTAVRSFCDQHGLAVSNEATPEMQQLLYSSNAQYYSEPYIPLVIGATFKKDTPIEFGGYGSYDGRITIQLVNRSSTRGIRGYVLYYYQTNMYGEKINLAPSGTLYEAYFDEMNYIEPAHYKDAFSYVIKNYYGTYAVYVGIQKIVFDDGEIREIDPSDIDYYECVIAD